MGAKIYSVVSITFSPLVYENVCMITSSPTKRIAYFSNITVKNIYQSFAHKMAAKASWHRKLRDCHPMVAEWLACWT